MRTKRRREYGKCSVMVSDRGDRGLFVVCGFHVINIFPCPLSIGKKIGDFLQ
jgi:hypothetical protein